MWLFGSQLTPGLCRPIVGSIMKPLAVLGAGAWGTALARVLATDDAEVRLWTWQSEHAERMREMRENRDFFPGFSLSDRILPTADLATALQGAGLVVLVLPSHAFAATLKLAAAHIASDALLVSATKGIEEGTLRLMSEVVTDQLGLDSAQRFVALSGPSFAKEVGLGMPTNLVAASRSPEAAAEAQRAFSTERLRVYTSDDPVGVQLGGALKNVIAIAAGACDGFGFGDNARAALITRGIAEISRLGSRLGAHPLTLAGLAGVGDLVLTCTGELSRNRTVGIGLGRGEKLADVLAGLGHVAEGVITAKSAYDLACRCDVDMPITTEVYRVLHEGKPARDGVRDLVARPLRAERD